jgi:riboflavin kinase/FMN adenylyltransferase
MHCGHQAVLRRTVEEARRRQAPAVAITFDSHPRRVVDPASAPPMVTSLEHRLVLLADLDLDAALVLPFDRAIAGRSAENFLQEILLERLRMQAIVLGEDAHFGRDRRGTLAFLRDRAAGGDYQVYGVPGVEVDGVKVSSSAIRTAVRTGALEEAAAMLGRPVTVLGTVVPGQGVGRQLAFPTLNLDLHHELHPPQGVYVTVARVGSSVWPSVTNIGHRPTVDARDAGDVLIEIHVLGRNIGRLYGQTVEGVFCHRLREEKTFPSREELKAAIGRDVEAAEAWFREHPEALDGPPGRPAGSGADGLSA